MKTIKVTHDTVVNQIIRERVSTRGGGVEISLTKFGFRGEKMAAYQNYLGGGMLGRVMVNDTIRTGSVTKQLMYSSEYERLDQIGEILKQYLHSLTDPGEDTWEGSSYESNQNRPTSAY